MNPALLDILACPSCHGKLLYGKSTQELICRTQRLAYPIKEGIPVMMVDKARQLSLEEYERLLT
jgi:uncharacterized protein YbaR (Trm112 family)